MRLWNNSNLRDDTLYIMTKVFPFFSLAQMLHCGHGGQGPKKEDSEDPRCPHLVHLQSQVLKLSLLSLTLMLLRSGSGGFALSAGECTWESLGYVQTLEFDRSHFCFLYWWSGSVCILFHRLSGLDAIFVKYTAVSNLF